LLAQVVRWRVGWRWYVVALAIPALVMLAAFFLWQAMGGPALTTPPPAGAWFSIPILIVALLIPALFEEAGWRGVALPRLQGRFGWLAASLVVGVAWGVWHAPIWFIPEAGFGSLPFPVFMLFTMALSVLFTWLYNSTGGSVLLPALAHAAINAYPSPWNTAVYLLPEGARGIHIQIPVTIVRVVVAVLLVALKGRNTGSGSQVA
jgi:membrane protease YdiL (CAAX protease family)